MRKFLIYLLTEINNKEEDEFFEFAFVYWMVELFDEEMNKLKKDMKDIMHKSQKDNYKLELKYTDKNLKKIGVAEHMQPISLIYTKYGTVEKVDRLVDKVCNQLSDKVKNQILNALNTGNTRDVDNLLKTFLKNEKKTYSTVNKLMRISRTENTQMRTKVKLDIQDELRKQGFKIKRRWLHTLYNPLALVPENYHPRQDHYAMNGQIEDNNGYFHCGAFKTRGPGLFGIASEDINCRCDVDFVLEK